MAGKAKKRGGVLVLLLILVLIAAVGVQLLHMQDRITEAEAERDTLEHQLTEQKLENASLEAALERAEDPEYLQELAREQMGWVSPGQKDFYDVSN